MKKTHWGGERERERERDVKSTPMVIKKGTSKTSKEPRRGASSPPLPRKKGVVQTSYHTSL
jgi:hypothetical protein